MQTILAAIERAFHIYYRCHLEGLFVLKDPEMAPVICMQATMERLRRLKVFISVRFAIATAESTALLSTPKEKKEKRGHSSH